MKKQEKIKKQDQGLDKLSLILKKHNVREASKILEEMGSGQMALSTFLMSKKMFLAIYFQQEHGGWFCRVTDIDNEMIVERSENTLKEIFNDVTGFFNAHGYNIYNDFIY